MQELIVLLIIGICLSIDAFSVATVIGIYNFKTTKIFKISLTVGIFHFIMPILGHLITTKLSTVIPIKTNIVLSIILMLIALQMLIEFIKPTNKELKLNKFGTFLFALGVSLDSFSIGLGISAITENLLLSSTIFTLTSFSFTFLGLTLGKYINKFLKKYSYLLGSIMLFLLSIYFLIR